MVSDVNKDQCRLVLFVKKLLMLDPHRFRKLSPIAIFVVISSPASFALAQDATTAAASETSRDSPLLEEIIVTATRREVDVRSVPLSVHVITEEALARLGAASFADYAPTVPGLSFTDGGTGGEKQTIRGISTNTWFDLNAATAIYLDEVPMTNAGGPIGPPFNPDPMLVDVKRIEILRGPQGTLFGASAMGGAIRVITNEPNMSATETIVDATVTSTKDGEVGYGLHGIFNLPLNDGRAGIRAVGYHRDLGGYVDNVTTSQSNVNNKEISGGRFTGTFLLSDNARLTGRISYQDRQSDGFEHEESADGPRKQSRLAEPVEDEWSNFNLVLEVDLGWSSLTSSTSYLDRTVDVQADLSPLLNLFFGVSNPLWVVNEEEVSEFVQEVRLVSSGDSRFDWLVGIFYQDQDQDISQDFPSPGFDVLTDGLAAMFGPPDTLFVDRSNYTLEQIALFGDLSYPLTDRLEFSVGARWFEIDRDFNSNKAGLLFVMGQVLDSGSTSESDVTPKFSLNYAANENLTFYGTAAKGFRPGGVNPPEGSTEPECVAELAALGLSEFPSGYDSDSLWSYELGAKARWLGGRVQLNAAAYHIDWSDMQTSKLLNCGVGLIENAGAVDSDGIELELVSRLVDNFEFIMGASYNDAELREDVPNLGGRSGDRVPGVPELTAHLGATYYFSAFGGREAFVDGDYHYVGESYNNFDQSISLELPSYNISNIRIGLNTQQWSTALFINNVFDERGILFAEDNILGRWVTATRPRTVGLSTTWRF